METPEGLPVYSNKSPSGVSFEVGRTHNQIGSPAVRHDDQTPSQKNSGVLTNAATEEMEAYSLWIRRKNLFVLVADCAEFVTPALVRSAQLVGEMPEEPCRMA